VGLAVFFVHSVCLEFSPPKAKAFGKSCSCAYNCMMQACNFMQDCIPASQHRSTLLLSRERPKYELVKSKRILMQVMKIQQHKDEIYQALLLFYSCM